MADAVQTDQSGGSEGAFNGNQASSEEDKREARRSAVRVIVTYIAAGFLFIVGAGVIGFFLAAGQVDEAKDMFFAILPVAAAIVTYWFATRRTGGVDPESLEALRKMAEAMKPK